MRSIVYFGIILILLLNGLYAASSPQWIANEHERNRGIAAMATAKDGAQVIIKVEDLEYSVFQLEGSGFKSSESLNIISSSNDEVMFYTIQAYENGTITMGILPEVVGQTGGIYHMNILREEGSLQIQFPWGTGAWK